jgi:DNA polymerase-4
MNKPDGLTVIEAEKIEQTLSPLPIGRIWGIGPKTAKRLNDLGVKTIGDLRKLDQTFLRNRFGIEADRYLHLSVGDDAREVVPDHRAKSIGQERTFGVDLIEADHVRDNLLSQVEQVARRLRKHNLLARGVTLKIRDGEFNTITRSTALDSPTNVTDELWKAARTVFEKWASKSFHPVRLIGMQATRLMQRADEEPSLFIDDNHLRQQKLDAAVDKINQRFGGRSIERAKTAKTRRRAIEDE